MSVQKSDAGGQKAEQPGSAAVPAAGWKSVSTEMPDDELMVLVFAPADAEPVWIAYHEGDAWRTVDGIPLYNQVTHWMRFPEPPMPIAEALEAMMKGGAK